MRSCALLLKKIAHHPIFTYKKPNCHHSSGKWVSFDTLLIDGDNMYSNPQQNPNPGFQSPNYQAPPPKKSGPGCWLWVPVGCLAIVIISAIVIGVGVKTALQGPGGKGFSSSFGGIMQNAAKMADGMAKLQAINTATKQYYQDNQTYPASLPQLVPKYLPSVTSLHSTVDPNQSPTHVSFKYTRPANNAPPSTIYLSFTDSYTMTMGPSTQHISQTIQMSLDGKTNTSQTQSSTVSTGGTGSPTGTAN